MSAFRGSAKAVFYDVCACLVSSTWEARSPQIKVIESRALEQGRLGLEPSCTPQSLAAFQNITDLFMLLLPYLPYVGLIMVPSPGVVRIK